MHHSDDESAALDSPLEAPRRQGAADRGERYRGKLVRRSENLAVCRVCGAPMVLDAGDVLPWHRTAALQLCSGIGTNNHCAPVKGALKSRRKAVIMP
jgi:hypothetical protein